MFGTLLYIYFEGMLNCYTFYIGKTKQAHIDEKAVL